MWEAQLTAASGLLQGVGASEPALSELQMLVAEMRLLVPSDIVRVAELVAGVTYALAQVGSALPLGMRLTLGGMVTGALNVFVNAVRHEVGV